MMKIKGKGNKIYIDKWLILKPYFKQSQVDSYYLNLCNRIKYNFQNPGFFIQLADLDNEELDFLCCFLVSYFEDIISGTNLWNSFVKKNKELYGKTLPFFDTGEYYSEEINQQDVAFLIWYFLNTIQDENFIGPHNKFIQFLAELAMGIFDEEYETAPENEILKSYYHIPEDETDYYLVRNKIENILFHSYLFFFDTGIILKESEEKIFKENKHDEKIMFFLHENKDEMTLGSYTRLLSLRGNEWAAEVAGNKHPLYQDLKQMSKKVKGYFQYKGQDATHIYLEHIASEKNFGLTKKSYEKPEVFNKKDDIFYIGMVNWKGEWWFSGNAVGAGFNADLILDEKNSVQSRRAVDFLDRGRVETQNALQMQKEAFLAFNNNSQIAFLPAIKIQEFINGFIGFQNDLLKLTPDKIKESRDRLHSKGFFGGEKQNFMDFSPDSENGLVFFNPNSGVEIAMGINSAFPAMDNPFFNSEESEDDFSHLLFSEDFSIELVQYCIDNFKNKFSFLKDNSWEEDLKYLDFLLRFWKRKNYHTNPSITLV